MANDIARQFAAAKTSTMQTVQKQIASFARQQNALIMSADPRPAAVTRIVDGVVGALEETVRRKIVYMYTRIDPAVRFALDWCIEHSPEASGRYKRAWFVMVNGARVDDFSNIPADAVVTVTNDEPYSRKIDVGHMKLSVPPGIVEAAAQATAGRYGNSVTAQARYVTLPDGYILKGSFHRGHSENSRTKLRRDVNAGQVMTYPAVIIKAR